ncbi:lipooligosaccharide transport system permease protein [Allocatelliglobosispora scoriae]|uniref:Transport permease protein n=1 Tax=Allocatelliglobosispora scoriae TaxID=643052 RepID=A0A841BR68_9ACTN|nr:ABC transporter permease [Allocatelliglobosispora scoriae]MBB5869689.1 lipooligosaccharide transport system permease protein [Allocatelliglobosispora scoriae]
MAHPTIAVLERQLTSYRRLFWASAFSAFVLPVLFVLSIGVGVGGYVNANGGLDGMDYLSFIAPGVLASTAFQMAVGESTFPILGDFRWTRGFHAMRATPVGVRDMVGGGLLYIVFRVLVACLAFLLVAGLFGALHSWWTVVTPLVCGLLGAAVAAPVTAFSATIDNDNYFALLFRFGVIPSTLFAGVFFPVDQLPLLVRPVAYASPLWHGVELCRSATLGVAPTWPVALHVAYLLAWLVVGYLLATRAFRRKLEN